MYYTVDTQCLFWERVLCSNVLNIATGGVLAWVNIGNETSETVCQVVFSLLSKKIQGFGIKFT